MSFLIRKKDKFSILQKLSSYIYPLLIQRWHQPYYLELLLEKNELLLDSLNANQSNKALKKAFHLLFHERHIYRIPSKQKILLLGLGLGSIIELLQDRIHLESIVAFEEDTRVLNILEDYYGKMNFRVENVSAEKSIFLEEKFNLIIVDLFKDNEIPSFLSESFFWDRLKTLLLPNGDLIWNTLSVNQQFIPYDIKEKFDQTITILSQNEFYLYRNNIPDVSNSNIN